MSKGEADERDGQPNRNTHNSKEDFSNKVILDCQK